MRGILAVNQVSCRGGILPGGRRSSIDLAQAGTTDTAGPFHRIRAGRLAGEAETGAPSEPMDGQDPQPGRSIRRHQAWPGTECSAAP
jgi:hypothetical protein